jgi:hypothetical protein
MVNATTIKEKENEKKPHHTKTTKEKENTTNYQPKRF